MLQILHRPLPGLNLSCSQYRNHSLIHQNYTATKTGDSFSKHSIQFAGQKDEQPSSQKRASKLPRPTSSRFLLNLLAGTSINQDNRASATASSSALSQYDIVPYYQPKTDPFNYWETPNAEHPNQIPLINTESALDILASSSQNHYGFSNLNSRYTYYTASLLNELSRPSVTSIAHAHSNLEKRGYQSSPGYRPQIPVSNLSILSKGTCNAIWEKGANPKPARFALLMGNGPDFSQSLSSMEGMLKSLYGLDTEQVQAYGNVKTEDFESGIHQLAKQIKHAKQQGLKPELLIYYAGHGLLENIDQHHQLGLKEGEANGGLATANGYISENEVKTLIRKNLPEANTLLLLDSCFSGSWTGQSI